MASGVNEQVSWTLKEKRVPSQPWRPISFSSCCFASAQEAGVVRLVRLPGFEERLLQKHIKRITRNLSSAWISSAAYDAGGTQVRVLPSVKVASPVPAT